MTLDPSHAEVSVNVGRQLAAQDRDHLSNVRRGLNPKALRTHILRILGPNTIPCKVFGLF